MPKLRNLIKPALWYDFLSPQNVTNISIWTGIKDQLLSSFQEPIMRVEEVSISAFNQSPIKESSMQIVKEIEEMVNASPQSKIWS